MKNILIVIVVIVGLVSIAKLTHYSERMKEYNAHVCTVEGYQNDCVTKLSEGGE